MRAKSKTVGDVLAAHLGEYDWVILKDSWGTSIRGWMDTTPTLEAKTYKSYALLDGMELSKMMDVPFDRMDIRYLLFNL